MKTKLSLALIVVPAALAIGACAAFASRSPVPQEVPSPEPTGPRVLPTVSDPDCCYLPGQPVPLGYRIQVAGALLVGVVEAARPANDLVLSANLANPSPPPGFEYLLVRVSLQCPTAPDNPCDLSTGVQFLVEGPGGFTYDAAPGLSDIPDPFDISGVAEGAIAEGNIVYLVPIESEDLTVAFTWPNWAGVSLAIR